MEHQVEKIELVKDYFNVKSTHVGVIIDCSEIHNGT